MMYVFAIAALLGLGVMALAHCARRYLEQAPEYRSLTVVIFGLLGAWLADFDVFARWGVPVRKHWIGVVLTGLAIAGLAHAWHELLGVFSGLVRKTNDEAEALELTQGRKAA
jgi:protein-S-isoprenylcysteine O-methyltransferase Ste14